MKVKLVREEYWPVWELARPEEDTAYEIEASQEDLDRWQKVKEDFDRAQEEIRSALKRGSSPNS
jgi:hypothetical protein